MRSIQYDAYGPPDVLELRELAVPEVIPGHVLVRIHASSINGADVAFRSGKLKFASGRRFPKGTGFDYAGEVVDTAADVTDVAIGDRIWGFLSPKLGATATAADFAAAPVDRLAVRPRDLDSVGAAALTGVGAASIGVLRDHAHLQAGERVLIRGGAGGVGSTAVQVARALGGHVTALARPEHLDRVGELGAHETYDYRSTDPRDLPAFDVVVDPVASDLSTFRRSLAPGGRMVTMAIGSPGQVAYMLASRVFGARRVRFAQAPPTRELLTTLTEMVERGDVSPVVDDVFALEDIAAAHRSVEAGGGFGKRVVRVA